MNPEDELVAAWAAGAAAPQRQKDHWNGTVVDYDPNQSPKIVTLTLEGGSVQQEAIHHAGYNAGTPPAAGDQVRVEVVGIQLVVVDKIA